EHRLAPRDAARFEGYPVDSGAQLLGIALPHGRSDEHAPADHAQRGPEVGIEVTHPPTHTPALAGAYRAQRRTVERLIDVLHHRSRLGQHPTVVHQRRNRPVGVDPQVLRAVLVEFQQVQVVALVGHALFGQSEHGFAGIGIRLPVVQRQHRLPSSTAPGSLRQNRNTGSTEREIGPPAREMPEPGSLAVAAWNMPALCSRENRGIEPMSSTDVLTDRSFLARERTIAGPGFSRWLVPPAALAIHLCIGMAYGFSVFWFPLSQAIGITRSVQCPAPATGPSWFLNAVNGVQDLLSRSVSTTCDWKIPELQWMFILFFVFLGSSSALFGGWAERSGPRKTGVVAA